MPNGSNVISPEGAVTFGKDHYVYRAFCRSNGTATVWIFDYRPKSLVITDVPTQTAERVVSDDSRWRLFYGPVIDKGDHLSACFSRIDAA